MSSQEPYEFYEVKNEGEAEAVSLMFSIMNLKRRGIITEEQFDRTLKEAERFKKRLLNGEAILSDQLDAPPTSGRAQ